MNHHNLKKMIQYKLLQKTTQAIAGSNCIIKLHDLISTLFSKNTTNKEKRNNSEIMAQRKLLLLNFCFPCNITIEYLDNLCLEQY